MAVIATGAWLRCPFAKLTFKAKKPNRKPYPKELKTYGDHLRKKRLDLEFSQPQVAKIIKVDENSITQWELNHTNPQNHFISWIFSENREKRNQTIPN